MSQHDDDIQFDFFEDEPATSETAQQSKVRLPRRGGSNGNGGGSSLAPPRGPAPLLRLLGLVAVAVGVILLFAVLINSCAGTSRKDSYANYMEDVQQIATQSTANGKRLQTVLTTPGACYVRKVSVMFGDFPLGTNGITADHGLTTPDPDEAAVKRAIVGCGHLVVALADASKFGLETAVRFASPDDVDVVVTDEAAPAAERRALTKAGIEVVVA